MNPFQRRLLDPQGGEGNGTTVDTNASPEGRAADAEASFQRLLSKHKDDAIAVARLLFGENKEYRAENASLRDKVPGGGSVVLSPDDAKLWSDLKSLGKADDVRRMVKEHPTLQARLKSLERKDELRAVAEAAGLKPSVLERLAGEELTFAIKDEADPKDPKTTRKVVHVKDGDAEPVPIDRYADEHWPDFKSALFRQPAAARGTPAPDAALRPPPVPGEGGLTEEQALKQSILRSGFANY